MNDTTRQDARTLVRSLLSVMRDLADESEDARDELIQHRIDPEGLPNLCEVCRTVIEKKSNHVSPDRKEEKTAPTGEEE